MRTHLVAYVSQSETIAENLRYGKVHGMLYKIPLHDHPGQIVIRRDLGLSQLVAMTRRINYLWINKNSQAFNNLIKIL